MSGRVSSRSRSRSMRCMTSSSMRPSLRSAMIARRWASSISRCSPLVVGRARASMPMLSSPSSARREAKTPAADLVEAADAVGGVRAHPTAPRAGGPGAMAASAASMRASSSLSAGDSGSTTPRARISPGSDRPWSSGTPPMAASWAGMRGAVSLAAALALPPGSAPATSGARSSFANAAVPAYPAACRSWCGSPMPESTEVPGEPCCFGRR